MKHFYCSIFSKNYIYKGILLYKSLAKLDKDFHFFMICLSDEVKDLLVKMNLKNVTPISMSDIEKTDKELYKIKKTRNEKEYAWTSKASAMLYILNNFNKTDHIVWLDGDTYFYSDPQPIYDEWTQNYSIMLTEERWRKNHKNRNLTTGIYNTGFMGFRKDEYGLKALNWFREKLIKWCYDRRENGLWSDQVYVNDWPKRFQRVGIIKNIGVNVGPYIIQGCEVTKVNDQIYVNGKKLIFYHSYGFKYFDGNEFDLCVYATMNIADEVIRWIYLPYINATNDVVNQIRDIDKSLYSETPLKRQFFRNYFNLIRNENVNKDGYQLCTLFTKDYLTKGVALYNSIKRNTSNFHLWALCVDDISYDILTEMNLENVTLVSLDNIKHEQLTEIEKKRRTHEFCWTLKAPFISYLLKNNYNMETILYIDADLYFFDDIKHIYEDWGNESLYITKLRLGPRWDKKVGKYSAGLIGFKRNKEGMEALGWWRGQCLKWCYDKYEQTRWGDQKYLDKWPKMISSIKISQHLGINTGPWNLGKGRKLETMDTVHYFKDFNLICYHFSGFKIFNGNEFELCNRRALPAELGRVYDDYVQEIVKVIFEINKVNKDYINLISSSSKETKVYNYYSLLKND